MRSSVKIQHYLVRHLLIFHSAIPRIYNSFRHFRYEVAFLSMEKSLHETDIESTSAKEKAYHFLHQIL
jgi:hypothetical protein